MFNNNNKNNSFIDNLLLILQFNTNDIKNHVLELETVLNNKRIEIALITETHFTKYTILFIPGYKLIKTNHPDNTTHGGVAIFVKSTTTFHPIPSFCHDYLQSCAIVVHFNTIPLTIDAVHSLLKHNIANLKFSEYFDTIKNNFIIDDYNTNY